nr:dihydrolipoyllysine-residue acetyltransferase component of pyruvate dehydrogenase complex, mitochondrial-like [Procambarus clarkii]
MAAVGRAGFGWLPRNLYRINACQSLKLNYACVASFHNTSALNAGFLGFGEDDDYGSFMENLFEVHNQLAVNDHIEVSDSIFSQNANNFDEAQPKFMQTKQMKENEITQHQNQIMHGHKRKYGHERENEAERETQSLSSDWSNGAKSENKQNDITTMLEKDHTIEHLHTLMQVPAFMEPRPVCIQEIANNLIVPLEAKLPIELQSKGLSDNVTQIKFDNVKTSGVTSQENSANNEVPLQDTVAYSDNAVVSKPSNQEKREKTDLMFEGTYPNAIHSSTLIQTEKADTSFSASSYVHSSEMQEYGTASSISSRAQPVQSRAVLQVPEDTKDVKVGTLIAVMVEEGEDWKAVEMPSEDLTLPSGSLPVTASPTLATVSDAGHGNYGPSVRLLLEQYGLSASQVPAGGPHGRLLKGDVLQAIKDKNLQPRPLTAVALPEVPKPATASGSLTAPTSPIVSHPLPIIDISDDGFYDIEVTNMRRTIAKRLTQSKGGIAHSYGTIDCCVDKLVALRKQYKKEGISVSINDLIIKAVAVALNRCPEMNCVWRGDQLVMADQVDISIAVATPAGLITPIIHGADTLGVEDIATKVHDLAGRARENKLKLDEFQGGTFTISNLGMFGISEFSAIINPPQCGILAIGGSRLLLEISYFKMFFQERVKFTQQL